MSRKSNGNKAGWKKVDPAIAPFWSPWRKASGHDKTIECAFMGRRELPARGKFNAQTVIDVETENDGPMTIALKGNLKRLVDQAKLREGQPIMIEWKGKVPPSERMPLGFNDFDLYVQE